MDRDKVTSIETLTKSTYLGKYLVVSGYLSIEEYKKNAIDYNMLCIEYADKLGIINFHQSIKYYCEKIENQNIEIKNKYYYLLQCLESSYNRFADND